MALLATIATLGIIGGIIFLCIAVIGAENIAFFFLCALIGMIVLGLFLFLFGEILLGICFGICVLYTFFKELFKKPKEEDNSLPQKTTKTKDLD